MSEDEDAADLSHLTSKMPAPPPRPPSVASSTRSSSRRSSTASSFHRLPKHISIGADDEHNYAPPTPSVSSRYLSNTLFDEMKPMHSVDASTSGTVSLYAEKSPSLPRMSRNKSPSSERLLNGKRRNSRAIKERDREGPVSSTARPLNVVPQHITTELETTGPFPISPGTSFTSTDSDKDIGPQERLLLSASTFLYDLGRACYLMLSLVVWPLVLATADSIAVHITPAQVVKVALPKAIKLEEDPAAITSIEKAFAEQFKYVICTSFLLTKTLSISSYDQTALPLISLPAAKETPELHMYPASIQESRLVTAGHSDPRRTRSSLHLTPYGVIVFEASIIALVALVPISSSKEAWMRGAICLFFVAWMVLLATGIDDVVEMTFEISHRPTGAYKLRKHDEMKIEKNSDCTSSSRKAGKTKELICEQITAMTQACKGFDIECNKAIAAVQEVELISRGFKLSHPLPPISRIEANDPISSPNRPRNGSWQGISPAPHNSAARLSRSSSGGASATSHSRNYRPRPQSIILNNGGGSSINGRTDSYEVNIESIRMLSLRQGLISSFEDAKKAMKSALEDLAPFVDKTELRILEEVYAIESTEEPSGLATVDHGSHFASGENIHGPSWAPSSRSRVEDEPVSPVSYDESERPSTPQRFSLLFENTSMTSSTRKRDSGMSETWSVASPSRDSSVIRGGSRLGYISEKAKNITPNQTAESKRLSYISSSNSPLHAKQFSMQQTNHSHRKRASLLHSGLLDDLKQSNSVMSGMNTHDKTESYLITSLKASFEEVHLLRKKVLCHFLALNFIFNWHGGVDRDVLYWGMISRTMKQLTTSMQRLTVSIVKTLQEEMRVSQQSSADASSLASPDKFEQQSQDYTGVEDRIAAMSLSLRSIQVKMLVCAKDLKVKKPTTLHGLQTTLPNEDNSSTALPSPYEKSEKIFETIRDDLLSLSAEWENALKILRLQSISAVGDTTTSSTINSSRLDSPQEAEEDALRQWIQARRGEDEKSDSEDERTASRIIESGLLQWSGLDNKEEDEKKWQGNIELSDLLIKTASPDHLPPPGLEKVYESIGGIAEAKRQKSSLTREERIQSAKSQREQAANQKLIPNTKDLGVSTTIIEELQAVMKNRKSLRGGESGAMKAGLHSPHIPDHKSAIDQSTPPPTSIDDKQVAIAL